MNNKEKKAFSNGLYNFYYYFRLLQLFWWETFVWKKFCVKFLFSFFLHNLVWYRHCTLGIHGRNNWKSNVGRRCLGCIVWRCLRSFQSIVSISHSIIIIACNSILNACRWCFERWLAIRQCQWSHFRLQ